MERRAWNIRCTLMYQAKCLIYVEDGYNDNFKSKDVFVFLLSLHFLSHTLFFIIHSLSLSLSLSLSISFSLSLSQSLCLPFTIFLVIYLSIVLTLYVWVSKCSRFLSLSLSLKLSVYVCLFPLSAFPLPLSSGVFWRELRINTVLAILKECICMEKDLLS